MERDGGARCGSCCPHGLPVLRGSRPSRGFDLCSRSEVPLGAHQLGDMKNPLDVGHLQQARGGVEVGVEAPGAALPGGRDEALDCYPLPVRTAHRSGDTIKVGGVRRGRQSGSAISGMVPRDAGQAAQSMLGRQVDSHRSDPGRSGHQQRHGGSGAASSGNLLDVPSQARECLNRRSSTTSAIRRHHAPRKMAESVKPAEIRERRAVGGGVRKAAGRSQKPGHPCGEPDQRDFRTWYQVRTRQGFCGLEIFSGSGHLARAAQKAFGHQVTVFQVDVQHGPQFDLTQRRVQRELVQLIQSGQVAFVWLGTPCNSWSTARRFDGKGPGPIRSDTQVMGLDNTFSKRC